MGARNELNFAHLLKKLAKFIGRLLSLVGYPFYLILESAIILSLALFYQIGQLILRRAPFVLLLAGLGTKFIFLKLKSHLLKFAQKPHFIPPLLFFKKLKTKIEFLPAFLHLLKKIAKEKIPLYRRPKLALPPAPTRVKVVGAGLILAGIIVFSFWLLILRDLPSPEDLVRKPRPLSTHILDREGRPLFKIFRNQNRTRLPLSEIPLPVQQATIAIEDAEFYTHPGFSLRGVVRATQRNLLRGELAGGSTITQQLVKNALLVPEKTLRRKIKEIILAILTEMKFSKKEILTMYLNEVSYGGAAYGIEEAAQLYFGKEAQDLTLAEAALLTGLPAAPTRFSPFGTEPTLAKIRQKLVLARMVEEGFITPSQGEEAGKQELVFAPQKQEIRAPHFVMFVRQILIDKYGLQQVEEGGLTVITSLDVEVQEKAEKIVKEEVNRLAGLRVGNGAALVTRPLTGEILAMVGSRDYFDVQKEGNFNVTTALRQPGSAIKPVNYSYALNNGYTPATIIADTPVTYNVSGQPPYTPRNYDRQFRGNVPLRIALGSSLNVPAVKVLASYGVQNMIEQGKKMGITSWNDPSRFGLSLTLGGGEVKMTDLSIAYGTLANYGKKVPLRPILKVTDSSGKVLEEGGCAAENCEGEKDLPDGSQVLDPRVAFLLTNILSDNWARIPAFGPNSLLVIPAHPEVAVKTGTTQNLRDNWAVGYTKDFVVAAWVGNNDNRPMSYVASGVTGATPIWHKIIRALLEGKPNEPWEVPQGLVKIPICSTAGTLPCEGCPGVREEYFLVENQPKNRCDLVSKKEEEQKKEKEETIEEEKPRLFERRRGRNR